MVLMTMGMIENKNAVILTGTRAYGPVSPTASDWDIVMYESSAIALHTMLKLLQVVTYDSSHIDPSYKGFWFYMNQVGGSGRFSQIKVQIIVAESERQFEAWKWATNEMKKHPPVEDRAQRITTFRDLWHSKWNELQSIMG